MHVIDVCNVRPSVTPYTAKDDLTILLRFLLCQLSQISFSLLRFSLLASFNLWAIICCWHFFFNSIYVVCNALALVFHTCSLFTSKIFKWKKKKFTEQIQRKKNQRSRGSDTESMPMTTQAQWNGRWVESYPNIQMDTMLSTIYGVFILKEPYWL